MSVHLLFSLYSSSAPKPIDRSKAVQNVQGWKPKNLDNYTTILLIFKKGFHLDSFITPPPSVFLWSPFRVGECFIYLKVKKSQFIFAEIIDEGEIGF